jgi:hypothetical protein
VPVRVGAVRVGACTSWCCTSWCCARVSAPVQMCLYNTWCLQGCCCELKWCLYNTCRVGQNHIYTVYKRYFWQGNHQIYGNIRCIYTVLANPKHLEFEPHKSLEWLACEGVTLIEEVLVQCFVFEPHQFLEWYKQNRRVQCPDYVL